MFAALVVVFTVCVATSVPLSLGLAQSAAAVLAEQRYMSMYCADSKPRVAYDRRTWLFGRLDTGLAIEAPEAILVGKLGLKNLVESPTALEVSTIPVPEYFITLLVVSSKRFPVLKAWSLPLKTAEGVPVSSITASSNNSQSPVLRAVL